MQKLKPIMAKFSYSSHYRMKSSQTVKSLHNSGSTLPPLLQSKTGSGFNSTSGSLARINSDSIDLLAPEKWSTVKLSRRLDTDIAKYYERQLKFAQSIRSSSNKQAIELFEKILFKIRWANPPIVSGHQQVMVEYCKHLLSDKPDVPFPDITLLDAFYANSIGSEREKIVLSLHKLYCGLRDTVINRDVTLQTTKSELKVTLDKMTVKKEGTIRWQMETSNSTRDRYWTIWYLCSRGFLAELKRYLSNPEHHDEVNKRDPEHGLAPIHYAIKRNDPAIFRYLREHFDADVTLLAPDGRSCLHLASMYSCREIILELLALGADFHLKDNFGCTALELANQNKNREAFKVLSNWFNLIPVIDEKVSVGETSSSASMTSDHPDTVLEIDASNLATIPDEYHATPEPIIDKMSRILSVHTRRLCPFPAKSGFGFVKDPFLELRLCEKHASLCFDEEFFYDGFKSLRRRWRVAKSLLQGRESNQVIRQDAENPPRNGISLQQLVLPSSVVAEQNPIDTSHTAIDFQSDRTIVRDGIERPVDLESIAHREVVKYMNEISSRKQNTLPPVHVDSRLEAIAHSSYVPATHMAGYSLPQASAAGAALRSGSKSEGLSVSAVLDIGFDLAERCIKDRQEGFAVMVLEECVEIASLRLGSCSTKIAIYTRLVEVLIFLHDFLEPNNEGKLPEYWQPRLNPFPKSREAFTSIADVYGKYLQPTLIFDHCLDVEGESKSDVSSLNQSYIPLDGKNLITSLAMPATIKFDSADYPSNDLHSRLLKDEEDGEESLTSGLPRSVFTLKESISATGSRSITVWSWRSYRRQLLLRAKFVVEAAIAMHEDMFQAHVVEPGTLAPLLELQSDVFERQGLPARAHEVLSRAETVYLRALGPLAGDTVRVAMQVLRVEMKCTPIEGYQAIAQKALGFTRRLDELHKIAPGVAEPLIQKCAELIGLCRLLEEGKFNASSSRGIDPLMFSKKISLV